MHVLSVWMYVNLRRTLPHGHTSAMQRFLLSSSSSKKTSDEGVTALSVGPSLPVELLKVFPCLCGAVGNAKRDIATIAYDEGPHFQHLQLEGACGASLQGLHQNQGL